MKEFLKRDTLVLGAVGAFGLALAGHVKAEERKVPQNITAVKIERFIPQETPTAESLQLSTSIPRDYCRSDIDLGITLDWPVEGMINQLCSQSHFGAIDIGVPVGTRVRAAASGIVTFVGGNPCCSLGYYVEIDHGDGVQTAYGHLSGFAITNGEKVEKGEVIARSGSTGNSSGPHLHFELSKYELEKGNQFLDPRKYLP